MIQREEETLETVNIDHVYLCGLPEGFGGVPPGREASMLPFILMMCTPAVPVHLVGVISISYTGVSVLLVCQLTGSFYAGWQ